MSLSVRDTGRMTRMPPPAALSRFDLIAHNNTMEEIRSRVSNNIESYFPGPFKSGFAVQLISVQQRSYSTICFFNVCAGDPDNGPLPGIAVKIFSHQFGGAELADLQFTSMKSVWPSMAQTARFAIPRPLELFHDLSAMAMERVGGDSIQRQFRRNLFAPLKWPALVCACLNAGEWLRYFHTATQESQGQLDVTAKKAAAGLAISKLQGRGFPGKSVHSIEVFLDTSAQELSQIDLPAALVHGDFTVDNVIAEGTRITALDLSGRDRNAIYHDLATFLNSLWLMRLSMPLPDALLNRCARAFLKGYFGDERCCHLALNFLRVTGLVSSALEIISRRQDQPIAQFWVRRFLNHQLGGIVRSSRDTYGATLT